MEDPRPSPGLAQFGEFVLPRGFVLDPEEPHQPKPQCRYLMTSHFISPSLHNRIDQPRHQPVTDQMTIHQFVRVCRGHAAVPDAIGINRYGWPLAAATHT